MKKYWFFLFLIVLLLQGCSCKHEFEFNDVVEEPTKIEVGVIELKCKKCSSVILEEAPILSGNDYSISVKEASCYKNGEEIYSSAKYGKYVIQTDKKPHYSYGGFCIGCDKVINNLEYNPDDFIKISSNGGYPRLYVLNDGTWLCGYDTGKIYVMRSTDEGQTWSTPIVASVHNDYACANVAFYQFENDDILCAYRAIGKDKREIQCTISKDGGLTWEFHSTIEDNFETAIELGYSIEDAKKAIASESRIGFFEPHFGIVNDKLTVMYADDFTTMLTNPRGSVGLNYETQYIVSRTYNEESQTWENRKVILDGTKEKTVGNITDFSRDGMPVFDRLSDGTYVLVVEGTYRRKTSGGNNPFIILLSYSKDGITWSNPVEVYVPKGDGTKASAPYICVTKDDRIVISFQTDEDSYKYGKGRGDNVSIMKTIISDGTPIEEINKDSFSEAVNVFGVRPGDLASWNGMYMHNDTLYCVSGVRGTNELYGISMSGVYMASSKISEVENVGTYYDKEVEIDDSCDVISGSIKGLSSGFYQATSDSTVVILDEELENGKISVDFIAKFISLPQLNKEINNYGIMFKYVDKDNYYALIMNYDGNLLLGKMESGKWTVIDKNSDLVSDYSRLNRYSLEVCFEDGNITCLVDGDIYIKYYDEIPLSGNKVGITCKKELTLFKIVE